MNRAFFYVIVLNVDIALGCGSGLWRRCGGTDAPPHRKEISGTPKPLLLSGGEETTVTPLHPLRYDNIMRFSENQPFGGICNIGVIYGIFRKRPHMSASTKPMRSRRNAGISAKGMQPAARTRCARTLAG